jgi:hypothetical protein
MVPVTASRPALPDTSHCGLRVARGASAPTTAGDSRPFVRDAAHRQSQSSSHAKAQLPRQANAGAERTVADAFDGADAAAGNPATSARCSRPEDRSDHVPGVARTSTAEGQSNRRRPIARGCRPVSYAVPDWPPSRSFGVGACRSSVAIDRSSPRRSSLPCAKTFRFRAAPDQSCLIPMIFPSGS